ncbi:MAG: signal peptidase I [Acidimicrobiales bacterium]
MTQPVRAETTREVPAAVAESPQEEPATTGIRRARRKKSSRRNMVEWAIVVVGAVLIAVVLRSVAIQAFYIPSASMEPTLEIGDRVLVNKLTYRVREPRRGDIVVFERPVAAIGGTVDDLIKRVIGLPGEVIEAHDGRVFVDGEELEEPWLADGTSTPDFAANQVPPGHVFVLGDNRSNSEASNRFGPVDDDLIVGRAFVLIWPLDRIGGL